MKAQVKAQENEAPVGDRQVNESGSCGAARYMQGRNDLSVHDESAYGHGEHDAYEQKINEGAYAAQRRIAPFCHIFQPAAVNDVVDYKEEDHGQAQVNVCRLADEDV